MSESKQQTFEALQARVRESIAAGHDMAVSWHEVFDVEAFPPSAASLREVLDRAWQIAMQTPTGRKTLRDVVLASPAPIAMEWVDEVNSPLMVSEDGRVMGINPVWLGRGGFLSGKGKDKELSAVLVHEADHIIRANESLSPPCSERKAVDREDAYRAQIGLPVRRHYADAASELKQLVARLPDEDAQKLHGLIQDQRSSPWLEKFRQFAKQQVWMGSGCTPMAAEEVAAQAAQVLETAFRERVNAAQR